MKDWFMSFLANRLSETSTWKGLIAILTLVGVHLSPEQTQAIIALGVSIYGLLAVLFPDKLKKTDPVPVDTSTNPEDPTSISKQGV